MPMQVTEMDERVSFMERLQQESGPAVLVNTFTVPAQDAERLLAAWAEDAAFMKQQPGFISTQLHRGIAGSTAFVNVVVRETASVLQAAFMSPAFQAHMTRYPDSAVTQPHLFQKVAVPGICVA
jgi:heme-degrading monooxygenase HmoA